MRLKEHLRHEEGESRETTEELESPKGRSWERASANRARKEAGGADGIPNGYGREPQISTRRH